ncbi:MAG: type II toxin-antitoxin system RelE/ParE family toxin [Candidatus Scalindua sp.]
MIWSYIAEQDLERIIKYIVIDSPANALKILAKIKKKSATLYSIPERGRLAPELLEFNILQYREVIIDPWRVIHKVIGKEVFVVSVIDSRRNVEDILLDRLVNHKT